MKILQDKFIDDSEILLLSHSPEKKITLLFWTEYAKENGCISANGIYYRWRFINS
jgi:hypothetical protein